MAYKRKTLQRTFKEFALWIKENYPDVDPVTTIKSLARRYPDRKNLPSEDQWHIDDIATILIYMDGRSL
jgi:hypothetical protein